MDDLDVWGKDVEKHDVRLRQVLDHCRERNLGLTRRNAILEYLRLNMWTMC